MIKPIADGIQISCKAVSYKYLKKAQEEALIMKTISGDLIENLQFDILMRKISPQDGIDTISSLRQYTKKKYQCLLDTCEEMCKSLAKRKK